MSVDKGERAAATADDGFYDDILVIAPEQAGAGSTQSTPTKDFSADFWASSSTAETRSAALDKLLRHKSNSMPASRSVGDLLLSFKHEDSAAVGPFEKTKLRVSKSLSRSSSTRDCDRRPCGVEKPRSRTPQPMRKILSRARSNSPHHSKHSANWSVPRDPRNEADVSTWSKTVKFLARKTPGTPFLGRSHKEPHTPHAQGISELGENVDTASFSAAETIQIDGVDASNLAGGVASDMPGDVPDGAVPATGSHRENLRRKIMKTSEQIKIEQQARDENVAEYLRLSQTADKQQAVRMKTVFEKKNLKSKAVVAQLQKKLDGYHRKLRDLDSNGGRASSAKYGLKDVQAKFSDISGGVASSVQGITNKLKTSNKKYPSVDNIAALKDEFGEEDIERSNSIEDVSGTTSDSGEIGNLDYPHSAQASVSSLPPRPSSPAVLMATVREQIATLARAMNKLPELENEQALVKTQLETLSANQSKVVSDFEDRLRQVNFRCADLSNQIQDLTDLHRREMDDVRQELSSMEEKLEYHAQERARDMREALEGCETRITKMEVQQQQQHQQLVTMEGVENATAKALVGKLINLLLSVLAVLLVFASTISSILTPFVRNQTRAVTTGVILLLAAVLYRNWTALGGVFQESWWWR